MDGNRRKWILFLCIFTGLSVLNYPFVSQLVNMRTQSNVIRAYQEEVESLQKDELEQMWEAAEEYNRELFEAGERAVQDAFSAAGRMSERYAGLLNADGSGIMGYLSIPDIHVYIPVYHGTSVRALENGAGHLEGTSLPVGGEDTHAVISAHNGLPSKLFFTDLDQLKIGDCFFLNILGKEMAYEADQILVVEPHESDALQITEGEDYVTLVTCTPYGVNSHRYLVRGHRVPWEEKISEDMVSAAGEEAADSKWVIGRRVCILSVLILLMSAAILFMPGRKEKEK